MIYTVTFNPSIDYVMQVPSLILGQVNRSSHEWFYPGGKGINVSIMLSNLEIESKVLGFTAGFTGAEINRMLNRLGCKTEFINLPDGDSRINVKLHAGQESEINGQGPDIPESAIKQLFDRLDTLTDGDTLVLAGSIPNSIPSDIYEQIMKRLQNRKTAVVVDATKELLLNVLKYRPFLIKPNHHELGEIFGVKLLTEEQIIEYGRRLQEMGARNVLISRAGDGAVLIDENKQVHISRPPEGKPVNSVGAGDSMVAGFLAGYQKRADYADAFYMGLCAGSASALSQWLADKHLVVKLLKETYQREW